MEKLTATLAGGAQLCGALSGFDTLFVKLSSVDNLVASFHDDTAHMTAALSDFGKLSGDIVKPQTIPAEEFTGAYEYTPSNAVQTILINNKLATSNITINPIPSNYGLITWNGSTLTVS